MTDDGGATSRGPDLGHRRLLIVLVGAIVVAALVVAVLALNGVWFHNLSGSTNQAVPDGQSPPSPSEARAALDYLAGPGKAIDAHEQATGAILALKPAATQETCRLAASSLDGGGQPLPVLQAVADVPDPVLRELLVNEHAAELVTLRSCGRVDSTKLTSLVGEVRQFHDSVATRRRALEAARGRT